LEQSKVIHALSVGAFDVTISPLIELWGVGAEARKAIPSQAKGAAVDLIAEYLSAQGIER
jgi:thiamine biosynthesis lipoprotein ApbE